MQQSAPTPKEPLVEIRSKVVTLPCKTWHTKNFNFSGIFNFQTEEKMEAPIKEELDKQWKKELQGKPLQAQWFLKLNAE